VPAPDDCVSYRDPPPPESGLTDDPVFPFWRDVIEGRPALGHAPWDLSPRGAAEVATWFRFEHFPADEHGRFDPLALLVAADMMPSAVFEKMGPGETDWFAPSVDLTVHLTDLPTGAWILNTIGRTTRARATRRRNRHSGIRTVGTVRRCWRGPRRSCSSRASTDRPRVTLVNAVKRRRGRWESFETEVAQVF
jgi:hypothetical protein